MNSEGEFKVSFGYQCNGHESGSCEVPNKCEIVPGLQLHKVSSFSCLSGAALSANATLANTNICNGLIATEILPSLDSPTSFRRVPSSSSFSRLDMLSSSLQSSMSILSCSPSSPSDLLEYDSYLLKSMSAPSRSEGFLSAMDVQMAGGAAGEDRVQAVCSEEHGWLFCAIYDGFNGRDAADFLAGTLYETVLYYSNLVELESKSDAISATDSLDLDGSLRYVPEDSSTSPEGNFPLRKSINKNLSLKSFDNESLCPKMEISCSHRQAVLDSLQRAFSQVENDFLHMVEQEMEERPDLVSVGSCVLVVLIYGNDLYTLNLGDSRALLASYDDSNNLSGNKWLKAIQLTDSHTVDNEIERTRLLSEHPDDPAAVVSGKVKGKLKVTRAFGVGYLKKEKLNDALMGILRVHNLISPPYISTQPSLNVHKIAKNDHFVIVASDGLFDFFGNVEAVELVHSYILSNPSGDPAKFLLENLVERAAECAGFSMEELMRIPAGMRRKYHDDVTVIVIILGTNQRTSRASTCMKV
ncbi:probable protein phosphatase 2C 40 [Mangifera indica]|uniref:probable protein phosphatase 2C 40 n=1 Tax=Mangifera indica TaxID=29780 RepID=UPI001CFA0874|nr:probable protein phosphatase 2C 40 [Mangifera indica]